jgi:hypothetical protein
MGIFSRKVELQAAPDDTFKAAIGIGGVNNYLTYSVGTPELNALTNPTIGRSRDLLAAMIGSLELKHYSKQWNGDGYDEVYLPLEPWMEQPDPKNTRTFFMANIFSDLFFYGRAFAYVTTRYSTGLPASLSWIPAANVQTPNMQGPQFFGPADEVEFNGLEIDPNNVVQFISPIMGIIYSGARAINIALHLDQAADRYAELETPPGYLQIVSGEEHSAEDLSDLSGAWQAGRRKRAIGALERHVKFVEYDNDPGQVVAQLRSDQALDLARLCNIPAYMVSAPTKGASMTYQNAQQARQDLYLFGAKPFIDCIEQTLSMTMLPRGRYVEFDVEDYLGENEMGAPADRSAPDPEDSPE